MRDEAKNIPGGRERRATRAEGDRYLVSDLDGGHVEVVIDLGGAVVIHSGPAAGVRARIARDAPADLKAEIDDAIVKPGGRG